MTTDGPYETLNVRREGAVLVIGLNRPHKRNAFDTTMLQELATVYGVLDTDDSLRAGVLYGEGKQFTSGLDLMSVAPALQNGTSLVPEGGINPWQVDGRRLSKPLVAATNGSCLTLGIELLLTADITVAEESATFAQLEISRGIFPFGGATLRFPKSVGWGNAMRWMLTAEPFDAAEAHRIGLVQEVVPDGTHVDRAVALARSIAAQAPLGVRATLANARLAEREGQAAAEAELMPTVVKLFGSQDARIGLESFVNRTTAQFVGR
ncbi:crotonase/enoyl-CoA hydratase family protein [Streptomyces flaveolus]|uniref:crotonase/enoyl-CoA hydratase family protein n=1 Tax=Streptomyces flaveolus TaxID=67297 RepID=UPI0038158078